MTTLLTDNLPLLAGASNGIQKLRELILELAVRGKLVSHDASDEPASELLKRIAIEKTQLVAEGKLKKQKALSDVSESEKPFTLPVGWTWAFWDTIALKIGDIDHKMPDTTSEGVPFVSPRDFYPGNVINFDGAKRVSVEDFERLSAKIKAERGDLIYPRYGTIGENILVDVERDFLVSYSCAVIKVAHGFIDPIYQFYVSMSGCIRKQAKAAENKTTQANVGIKSIQQYLFPIPPLAEQHRIVAKVDELMALCDRLEAQQADAESAHVRLVQALLDSLTQACDATDFATRWQRLAKHFHTLFTTESSIDALKQILLQLAVAGKLVPQDPVDESAESFLQRQGIKSQPHTLNGWAKVPLGHLGEILGGSTPSKSNSAFWDGDIPWVSPKDMKRPVIHDAQDHISTSALAQSSLKIIPPNSMLMVVRGMILAHSFPVALTAREVTINQDMKALVPPQEISTYLLMYLQAVKGVMVELVDRSSHGTCKLISEKLWAHTVCLPPLAEQRRIVAKVEQLITLCGQLKHRLTQACLLNKQLANTLVEQAVA